MAEINKLKFYDGGVELDFYPNSHAFKLNGERLPSVTGILGVINKPALMYWAVNQGIQYLSEKLDSGSHLTFEDLEIARKKHTEKKVEAAAIGTKVHDWAHNYIKDTMLPLPEDEKVLNGVLAFLRWVKEHNVKFLHSEIPVYSKTYNYAGFIDAVAVIDNKTCLIDFKTSSGVYPEMNLQVAAYRGAKEEEGMKFDRSYLVHFNKESGEFGVYELSNHEEDFKAFLAAKTLKTRLNQLEK